MSEYAMHNGSGHDGYRHEASPNSGWPAMPGSEDPEGGLTYRSPDPAGLSPVLDELVGVLGMERQALASQDEPGHLALTPRKLQLLVKLNRITLGHAGRRFSDPVEDQLKIARRMLDDNGRLLKMRMQAIGEVAEMIATEIREAGSDGTYSV